MRPQKARTINYAVVKYHEELKLDVLEIVQSEIQEFLRGIALTYPVIRKDP